MPEYFAQLAAAYVRGKTYDAPLPGIPITHYQQALAQLQPDELLAIINAGLAHGLRLHRFKRTMELPRVARVLGMLRGIQPVSILDVGSGRGAFLWPLLDAMPELAVTCVDVLEHRVADILAVSAGGYHNLTALQGDITALPLRDGAFDVVTMLEVLEHIPDTRLALAQACRVATRFLLLSFPSKPDDNPEHIHLFREASLTPLLQEQGMERITYDYVPNHVIALVRRGYL